MPAETLYITTEIKLLAVIHGMTHFQVYLEGRTFQIFHDTNFRQIYTTFMYFSSFEAGNCVSNSSFK